MNSLEQKLVNATSQSQKEKYEMEMKKEIKKLQRVRDYFRNNMSNQEIKDKQKLIDGKKRIEMVSPLSAIFTRTLATH